MVWDDTVSVYMDVWSKSVVHEFLVDDTMFDARATPVQNKHY